MIDSGLVFKERRLGKFYVSKGYLESYPDEVRGVFHKLGILIVRAEFLYDRNAIEYIAYSVFFREIPFSEAPPDYVIVVEKSGTVDWTVRVQEVK